MATVDPFADDVPDVSEPVKKVAPVAAAEPPVSSLPVVSSDAQRILDLEAKLAASEAALKEAEQARAVSVARPLPESELSPQEKRIRLLEDQLAKSEAKRIESGDEVYHDHEPAKGQIILIHFVADGFTASGRVWYRGQELEYEVGGKAYEDTKDRNGQTWLTWAGNDREQYRRYGQVYFRTGPWPGEPWQEAVAATQEQARDRRAPALPAVR